MKRIIEYFIIIGAIISLIFSISCKKEDNDIQTPPTSNNESGTVSDIDGNIYNTVKIGDQWWMTENLKTTKYNDGTSIPNVPDNTIWSNLSTDAFCWYNNDALTYKDTYGALYNWHTINTGKLCPTGWHVPTDVEWTTLTNYLEGEEVAGGKLKDTGTTHWNSPNTGATNESGFTAFPGGYRYHDGSFLNVGNHGYWWSATEGDSSGAWYRFLHHASADMGRNTSNFKKGGFSVRCVKDGSTNTNEESSLYGNYNLLISSSSSNAVAPYYIEGNVYLDDDNKLIIEIFDYYHYKCELNEGLFIINEYTVEPTNTFNTSGQGSINESGINFTVDDKTFTGTRIGIKKQKPIRVTTGYHNGYPNYTLYNFTLQKDGIIIEKNNDESGIGQWWEDLVTGEYELTGRKSVYDGNPNNNGSNTYYNTSYTFILTTESVKVAGLNWVEE